MEIGTGCGSSGIWLLRGMRPGGVLTSVDTEPEYHRLARKAFTQAGFAANQARLILGRALDVLPRLSDGAYDLVFCDADQAAYPEYLTARACGCSARAASPSSTTCCRPARGRPTMARGNSPTWSGNDDRVVPLLLPIAGGLLAAIKSNKISYSERTRAYQFRRHGFSNRPERARLALPDGRLQCVTELRGLVGGQFDNEPAATFQRDAHHDATALLGHLERAIARPRLHRRHAASPSSRARTNGPRRRGARAVLREPRAPTASRGPYQAGPARQGDSNNRVDPSPYYPVFGRRMVMITYARRPGTRRKPPAGTVPEPSAGPRATPQSLPWSPPGAPAPGENFRRSCDDAARPHYASVTSRSRPSA